MNVPFTQNVTIKLEPAIAKMGLPDQPVIDPAPRDSLAGTVRSPAGAQSMVAATRWMESVCVTQAGPKSFVVSPVTGTPLEWTVPCHVTAIIHHVIQSRGSVIVKPGRRDSNVKRTVRTRGMVRGVSSTVAAHRAVTLSQGIVIVPRASSGYTVNSHVPMEHTGRTVSLGVSAS